MDAQQASETAEPTGAFDSAETEDSSEAVKEPADEPSNEVADEPSNEIADESDDVSAEVPDITAGIDEITKFGNIVLTIGPDSMSSLGYEPADIVLVRIGDAEMEMPIGTNYTDADSGEPLCCFRKEASGESWIILMINAGDLATTMEIAEKHKTSAPPGYEWSFADGLDASVPVYISMAKKQGYAEEYAMHQLGSARSNIRSDYEKLSNSEYANFRAVNTTGMGTDTLFRSSSPVNPALNRNEEADEALLSSMVRTIINIGDDEEEMKNYADYNLTNYSKCDIIAADMSTDFFSADFRQKLAECYRFMISHEGPYLIHCNEGKDRTGFVVAVLESFMGADEDEIVEDYMLTYYNFYGIEPGSKQYDQISAGSIEGYLEKAFKIPSIRKDDVDLQACAETYLLGLGLSEEELAALRDKLSLDYGGLGTQ